MTKSPIFDAILADVAAGKKLYWILLDPDDFTLEAAEEVAKTAESCGVNGILVGGSLMESNHLDDFVATLKRACSLPVILFPGDASQVSSEADAILFMSLISGRNPELLIGEQVKGALKIKASGVEPIPLGYMLIESGTTTSVEFMSNTTPIPRDKSGIAVAHALAGQYLGMKMLYLEAGSGAQFSVPDEMISKVASSVDIPVVVGGGIRTEEEFLAKLQAGANIVVTGNLLKNESGISLMKSFAKISKKF